jgi:signal transduction histidine kinase
MLENVFYNLVENTIRHGGNATEIRVRCEKSPPGLLLIYQDNGCGIPAGMKDRIFDYGVGDNTGLGLFLSREILSITGISVRETGEPGRGARFEIRVPPESCRVRT